MVRCENCGYLCYKNHETDAFDHVDAEARKSGQFPAYHLGDTPMYLHHEPYCFALAFDLRGECDALVPEGKPISPSRESVLKVISKERECPSFTRWRPGFSPKEHREMQFVEEQRKLDQEQRERDRAWQEETRRQDLEWKAKQESLAEERWNKEHRVQRHQLVIVGIVGTIVLAVAQIVGSLIQAGWFRK